MKFLGTAWDLVPTGSTGISPGQANYPTLDMSGAVPYVAYADYNNGRIGTMKKYSGGAWVNMGSPRPSRRAWCSFYRWPSAPGLIFRGVQDSTKNGDKLTVMECDGDNMTLNMVEARARESQPASPGCMRDEVHELNACIACTRTQAKRRYCGTTEAAGRLSLWGVRGFPRNRDADFLLHLQEQHALSSANGNSSNKATVMKYSEVHGSRSGRQATQRDSVQHLPLRLRRRNRQRHSLPGILRFRGWQAPIS